MNQNFRPDCFIAVTQYSKGNPPKRAFGIVIYDRNKKAFFECAGFVGKSSFFAVQEKALILALDYAKKFHNQKIALILQEKSGFSEEINELLAAFPFWRIEQGENELLKPASLWASKIFDK